MCMIQCYICVIQCYVVNSVLCGYLNDMWLILFYVVDICVM